jgi:hypothetical protein
MNLQILKHYQYTAFSEATVPLRVFFFDRISFVSLRVAKITTATYQLDARVDGVEEGARFVDELANGRGRSAGDKPEHLLRARPRTARRRARYPLRPPGRCGRRGVVPARGRGSRGRGG